MTQDESKPKVSTVCIHRLEGPVQLQTREEFDAFGEADKQMCRWSNTAPRACREGDHIEATVKFDNGHSLKLKYILNSGKPVRLVEFFQESLKRLGGRMKPPRMTDVAYAAFLTERPENVHRAVDLLDNYDWGLTGPVGTL